MMLDVIAEEFKCVRHVQSAHKRVLEHLKIDECRVKLSQESFEFFVEFIPVFGTGLQVNGLWVR
jgi:hypothetical protein